MSTSGFKERALGAAEVAMKAADTPMGRRLFSLFSRLLMAADMISDYAVTASLYQDDTRAFPVAVLLCLLPLVVLSIVLFRPAYRMHKRTFGDIEDESTCWILCIVLPLPMYLFAVVWFFLSPLVVVALDLALLTVYACIDPERTAQLIYYERLRMLTEVLFESIPQSLFQLSLARTEPVIIISVLISWMSLASHIFEMRREAKERNVSLMTHVLDVLSAGLGALPFIGAIRERRLDTVSYADLPLVTKDIISLLQAIEDGAKPKLKKEEKKLLKEQQKKNAKSSSVEKGDSTAGVNNKQYGNVNEIQIMNLSNMSISELRVLINHAGLSYEACQEKSQLVTLAARAKVLLIANLKQQELLLNDVKTYAFVEGALTSLDLSNVGLTRLDCQAGFEDLIRNIQGRNLGVLKHLALDRNDIGEAYGKKIGEAIATSAKVAQYNETFSPKTSHNITSLSENNHSSQDQSKPVVSTNNQLLGVLSTILVERKLIDLRRLLTESKLDFADLDLLSDSRSDNGSSMSTTNQLEEGMHQTKSSLPPFSVRVLLEKKDERIALNRKRWLYCCCYLCCRRSRSSEHQTFDVHSTNDVAEEEEEDDCDNGEEVKANEGQTSRSIKLNVNINSSEHKVKRSFIWKCMHCECLKFKDRKVIPLDTAAKIHRQRVAMLSPNKSSSFSDTQFRIPSPLNSKHAIESFWGLSESALALTALTGNKFLVHLTLTGVILSSSLDDVPLSSGKLTHDHNRSSGLVAASAARNLAAAVKELVSLQVLDVRGCLLDRLGKRYLCDSMNALAMMDDPVENPSEQLNKHDIIDHSSSESGSDNENDDENESRRKRNPPSKMGKTKEGITKSKDNSMVPGASTVSMCSSSSGAPTKQRAGVQYFACDQWQLWRGDITLNLDNCGLVDEDASLLSVLLKRNTELQVLSLCNNRIRAAGERALASVIKHHNRSLLCLDLSGCKRAAAGVALTEAALSRGASLATLSGVPILAIKTGVMTQVNLGNRNISAEGWSAMLASIDAGRKSTKSLDLSFTHITQTSSFASSSSSRLVVRSPLPTTSVKHELALGLVPILSRKNCVLRYLNVNACGALVGNRGGDVFMLSMAKVIPKNRHLTRLCIKGVGLTSNGKFVLAASLLASSNRKAPLCSMECDEWDLKESLKVLKLSAREYKETSNSSRAEVSQTSKLSMNSSGGSDVSTTSTTNLLANSNECAFFGSLDESDIALICALLGKHKHVKVLEIDADLFEISRPSDLAILLDPPHGTCLLEHLIVSLSRPLYGYIPHARTSTSLETNHEAHSGVRTSSEISTPRFNHAVHTTNNTPRDTPRDGADSGLAALLSGIRENVSLKSLQLELKLSDVGVFENLEPNPPNTQSASMNTSDCSRVGTSATSISWISALGDSLEVNTSVTDLVIRGDAVGLSNYSVNLCEALNKSIGIQSIELQLLGPAGLSPPKSDSGRTLDAMQIHSTDTTTFIALDRHPSQQLTQDGQSSSSSSRSNKKKDKKKKKKQGSESDRYRGVDDMITPSQSRILWLRVEANIMNDLVSVVTHSQKLNSISIHLLVPGFGFLNNFPSSRASFYRPLFGFRYLLDIADFQGKIPIKQIEAASSMLHHYSSEYGIVNETITKPYLRQSLTKCESAEDNSVESRDLFVESAKVALCRAAAPSNHRMDVKKHVLIKLNGVSNVDYMNDTKAKEYMTNVLDKIQEEAVKYESMIRMERAEAIEAANKNKLSKNVKPMIRNVRKAAATMTGLRGFFSGTKRGGKEGSSSQAADSNTEQSAKIVQDTYVDQDDEDVTR